MHWLYLVLAGGMEIVWAVGLKYSQGMTRPFIAVITVVAALLSFFLLSLAMKVLPLGTAYAMWTGIGAVGSLVFGVLLFGENISLGKIVALTLIVAGLVTLKLVTSE